MMDPMETESWCKGLGDNECGYTILKSTADCTEFYKWCLATLLGKQ